MKKLIFMLLLSSIAGAQTLTNVTATLTDSSSTVWSSATWTAEFSKPVGGSNVSYSNGGHPITPNQSGVTNSSGVFNVTLDDNIVGVKPGGTAWRFTICPNASVVSCNVLTLTITGATQNISAQLNAVLTVPVVVSNSTIMRAYNDTEVSGAFGTLYINSTNGTLRQCQSVTCTGSGWVIIGGGGVGIPGGSTNAIQINNVGVFGGVNPVAIGSELVSNGTSNPPIFQIKQAIDVRDYGVDCTDTLDSTTALASAITAAGNFGKIVFPAKCKVKISGTPAVSLSHIYGLEIEMLGRQGNNCDIGGSGGLDYQQAYVSGNTVVSIIDSQRLRIKGLVIFSNGNADTGMLIDQDVSAPPINTDNIFESICIYNQTATRNTSFNGILLSPTSLSNVEHERFRDIFVVCSNSAPTSATSNGNGFNLPGNSNAVNEEISYMGSTNCSKTINSTGGQEVVYQHILDSTGTTNTNIVMSSLNSALLFSRFENSGIALQQVSGSPTGPTLIMENDFTNAGTVMDCQPNGCGQITIMNNEKDTVPSNWFNLHTNRANSGLFAINNRNFSFASTDWATGAFVFPDINTIGTSVPLLTDTLSLRLTPRLKNTDYGQNMGSPFIDLQTNSGAAPQVDDYYIEAMPTGSYGGTTAATLVFGHSPTNGVTPWYSFQGTHSGISVKAISTPVVPVINTTFCSGGTSSWSYQVVAHDGNGTTVASPTGSTVTGCLNLSTGANRVLIPSVAGCTYFDVYRTAVQAGGTPNTTGKVGIVTCYNIGIQAVVADMQASALTFYDNGVAGDSSSPPVVNTTGGIILQGATSGSSTVSVSTTGGTLNLGSTNATVTPAGALTVISCTGCGGGAGITGANITSRLPPPPDTVTPANASKFPASTINWNSFNPGAVGPSTTQYFPGNMIEVPCSTWQIQIWQPTGTATLGFKWQLYKTNPGSLTVISSIQITFGGLASPSLTGPGTLQNSDTMSFAIDTSHDYYLVMDTVSGLPAQGAYTTSSLPGTVISTNDNYGVANGVALAFTGPSSNVGASLIVRWIAQS